MTLPPLCSNETIVSVTAIWMKSSIQHGEPFEKPPTPDAAPPALSLSNRRDLSLRASPASATSGFKGLGTGVDRQISRLSSMLGSDPSISCKGACTSTLPLRVPIAPGPFGTPDARRFVAGHGPTTGAHLARHSTNAVGGPHTGRQRARTAGSRGCRKVDLRGVGKWT